ncbi:uncharacterized protein B0T15DRAFT_181178 [Chaetomium strumarium]|uniref:Uncharacterized protein n=1 Tax=Chaetomium strumarium TaxID=1170767 RepID=A0AAJ0M3B0_9PEZI|nr:hypothetical protein B0T15DRAFT_181178 [Chaetomium strumarium]
MMRSQGPAALLAWLCAAASSALAQLTVSVFLPEYSDSDWVALRGSILSSSPLTTAPQDNSATAYTVFCAEQAPSCQIAGELPFVFTEGPHTLVYTGSDPGTLTADLRCELDGTTAATCTGSSSFGSNYRDGTLTGPTQTSWTKTFAAADVTWGVLALTTPGPLPGTTDIDGTVAATVTSSGSIPEPTTSGAHRQRRVRAGMAGSMFMMVVAVMLGFLQFG